MPIFICPTCLTIANTACDYYWTDHQDDQESCTGCRPKGHQGDNGWHGRFPRKEATGEWLTSLPDAEFQSIIDEALTTKQNTINA